MLVLFKLYSINLLSLKLLGFLLFGYVEYKTIHATITELKYF